MLSEREISGAVGSTAYGNDGDTIGTVEHFFVDDRTGVPSWVALSSGTFGGRTSVVPLQGASLTDGRLVLPVTREAVRSAPDTGQSGHLDPDDEARLRRHYGVDTAGAGAPSAAPAAPVADPPTVPVGQAPVAPAAAPGTPEEEPGGPAGRATDEAGGMVRSEERLQTSTERVPAKRVRIIKHVVTEEVQITVPLRREEIRIEEVPLDAPGTGNTDDTVRIDAALAGGAAGPSGGLPAEIVLHAERPVVTVEVVPTERVRLRIETVQDQETVTRQVRREQIVVDQQAVPGTGG